MTAKTLRKRFCNDSAPIASAFSSQNDSSHTEHYWARFLERVIPFQLMIYVPGVLWKAETELDYVFTAESSRSQLVSRLPKDISSVP